MKFPYHFRLQLLLPVRLFAVFCLLAYLIQLEIFPWNLPNMLHINESYQIKIETFVFTSWTFVSLYCCVECASPFTNLFAPLQCVQNSDVLLTYSSIPFNKCRFSTEGIKLIFELFWNDEEAIWDTPNLNSPKTDLATWIIIFNINILIIQMSIDVFELTKPKLFDARKWRGFFFFKYSTLKLNGKSKISEIHLWLLHPSDEKLRKVFWNIQCNRLKKDLLNQGRFNWLIHYFK